MVTPRVAQAGWGGAGEQNEFVSVRWRGSEVAEDGEAEACCCSDEGDEDHDVSMISVISIVNDGAAVRKKIDSVLVRLLFGEFVRDDQVNSNEYD